MNNIVLAVVVVLISCIVGGVLIVKKFIGTPIYYQGKESLIGQTVIITGGNAGIGKETALDLAKRGAKIILACRSETRTFPVVQEIRELCGHDRVYFEKLDLADLSSIRDFSKRIHEKEDKINILINNAGLAFLERPEDKTKDGFPLVFGTNHLGHFLLTSLLLDLIEKSAPSRIVIVSSCVHAPPYLTTQLDFTETPGESFKYQGMYLYRHSKLANVLHARELARRLEGKNVNVYSLHPGAIYSNIWQNMNSIYPKWRTSFVSTILENIFWDVKAGAQTTIYCAVAEELKNVTGKYFDNSKIIEESPFAKDDDAARKLWEISEELTGLEKQQ